MGAASASADGNDALLGQLLSCGVGFRTSRLAKPYRRSRKGLAANRMTEFNLDRLYEQFEAAWNRGPFPEITDFLPAESQPERQTALLELIRIDLEYRWRAANQDAAQTDPWTLATYRESFPELTDADVSSAGLLVEEYRVRRRWGDQPDPAEFLSAYGISADTVLSQLQAVDSELASEQTHSLLNSHEQDTVVGSSVTGNSRSDTADGDFGNYELLDEIARGGMGVVYRARQRNLNRIVALKMIKSGELAGNDEVQRFHAEAEAAAQLDHPGIVPIYEVGEFNGQHFFSMALVDGEGLDAKLKGGPLPSKEAARLLAKIAEAVQFAHDKGIVHRDLKPANVLIDAGGQPKVTDFGLAKNIAADSGMTTAGQVMGTPSYMPPEQAEGTLSDIGSTSDIYSLGATLYYLLTGRPPFQAATPIETLRQVIQTEPVPPRRLNPDIPRDLETITLKCLRKEQRSRYATAQELADDLNRWLQNKPIVARRVSVLEKAWLWCKRKPAIVGSLATVLLVIGVAAYITNEKDQQAAAAAIEQARKAEEENNRTRAEELVAGLKKADIGQVPTAVAELRDLRQWVDPILKKQISESRDGEGEKLRLSLALLPVDETQVGYLKLELLKAPPDTLPVIRDALKPHQDRIVKSLWTVLEDNQREARVRLNAACALATYDGENKTQWKPVLAFVAEQLVESIQNSFGDAGRFQTMLKPIRAQLSQPISLLVRDTSKTDLQRDIALATVLAFAHDDPQQLADVLASSEQRQFARTFDKLAAQKTAAIPALTAIVLESWKDETQEAEKERIAKRQANAAVASLKLGHSEVVWPLLRHRPDPRTRTYLIHWAARLGVDPQLFVNRLAAETDTSIRRALWLTLGEYSEKQFPVPLRQPLVKKLLAAYEADPDPGMHGCAAWLLRKWGHNKSIREIAKKLQANEEQRKSQMKDSNRRWYVNTRGQTFTVLKADVFRMGSPVSEPGRDDEETPHLRKVGRKFAIAAYEVTREQLMEFLREIGGPSNAAAYLQVVRPLVRTGDSPATVMTWFGSAAYCNWLSKKEGIPVDQWCYEKNRQGQYATGMKAKKNYLQLTGYRLPTEAEWEYACRAGAVTSRYYGLTETLLPQYARYAANSEKHTWPVGGLKPNEFGLFDMLGNAGEWCHDGTGAYPAVDPKQAAPDNTDISPVLDTRLRLLRGASFLGPPSNVRCANRDRDRPTIHVTNFGFRPARTLRPRISTPSH